MTVSRFRPRGLIAGRRRRLPRAFKSTLILLCVAPCDRAAPASAQDNVQLGAATGLRLSEEPTLSIGVAAGREEYELFEVSGAARLSDGSIVVYESGAFRVQRFGPDGEHLWSRGKQGEGPGDFQRFAELLVSCASEQSIVIHDQYNRRITVFDGDGELRRAYAFDFQGAQPYDITCSPAGRFVVSGWGKEWPTETGPYHTTADMAFADSSVVTILREDLPGEDRLKTDGGSAPGIWGRKLMFAATGSGIWLGRGDDYEIEFLDWSGTTTGRIRWEGPDLAVTQQHIDAYREDLHDLYSSGMDWGHRVAGDGRDWRVRFEARWERDREALPSAFPAYNELLIAEDGTLWIQDYPRPGESAGWRGFDQTGEWVRSLALPAGARLLDIGADWALVHTRDDLDVERLAVHTLAEN